MSPRRKFTMGVWIILVGSLSWVMYPNYTWFNILSTLPIVILTIIAIGV